MSEQEGMAQSARERASDVAIAAAKAAGEVLLQAYQRGLAGVPGLRMKADRSLQTEADLEAERVMITCVRAAFPDHAIESEEQGMNLGGASSPFLWRIDPLDGTENFVLSVPYFSSTLALCLDGQPLLAVVYEPVTGTLYTAQRGHGAWRNGERLHISRTSQFKQCRTFLLPDFVAKQQPQTARLRQALYQQCRRVLDTWAPALDWCLVASGRADLLVALSGRPIAPSLRALSPSARSCAGEICGSSHS